MNEHQQQPQAQIQSSISQNNLEVSGVSSNTQNSIAEIKYAGFWLRGLAYLIDSVILLTAIFLLAVLLGIRGQDFFGDFNTSVRSLVYWQILAVLISWSYMVCLTVKLGGTLGKLILRLQVVNQNQQKISWGKAILREIIGKFIAGIVLGLGYLWIAFDTKKQGWHDKLAGTYVIRNPKP